MKEPKIYFGFLIREDLRKPKEMNMHRGKCVRRLLLMILLITDNGMTTKNGNCEDMIHLTLQTQKDVNNSKGTIYISAKEGVKTVSLFSFPITESLVYYMGEVKKAQTVR